ncbi:glycosyltransferase family 39 protein [Mobilicoccus massiliensis]|uniref:glycosyltransferase family 39 protein n=1 Tax=Mobilicoccus massiliensis TaxID=1522310 RepID=UPI00058E3713|nr:glycosyltransferase family 39 protein [Mobilicoccus massiliensis]
MSNSAPRLPAWPAGWAAAACVAVVLLVTADRYGLHGDELYFRMLPLDWWYEDQPPLTVWLSRLARAVSGEAWVQRLPAVVAAAAGALVAARFPRLLGYGRRVQNVAAWAHATTVYPLIVGHVFLTSSLDLLAWQLVVLLVVAATLGRRNALVWAGVVAGLACWNKLLVLPLVGALAVSLLLVRRDLVLSRQAAGGVAALAVIGGPQVLAQAWHGWPMSQVSGDLIAVNGDVNRVLVLPLLVAFVGPPLFGVCVRGLRWRPGGEARVGLLMPAAVVLVVWNLVAPAQPYYAIGLFLCALGLGWGPAADLAGRGWRQAPAVIAANAAVACVLALPLLPVPSRAFDVAATINPVARDQVGWPGYVRQVDEARGGPRVAVVTDAYALAGAVDHYGGGIPVASGHNALWRLGPPTTDDVLLVGQRAVALTGRFANCRDAGRLTQTESDPFGVAGSPMARCRGPIGGWTAVWPAFRHLGA